MVKYLKKRNNTKGDAKMSETMRSILNRRSTRSYMPAQITDEQRDAIINAGRWAPTARNAQEIRIACVQDKALLDRLAADFAGGKPGPGFNYGAPTLFLLYGPKDFPYTQMDSGITVENMALAAETLGLGSVIIGCIRDFMNGAHGEGWRACFGIGADSVFTIALAVGTVKVPTPPKDREPGRVSYF